MKPTEPEPKNTADQEVARLPKEQVDFFNPWNQRFENDFKSDDRSFDF